MSKILLTGASGYIGGHLKAQLKENYEIIAISRNTKNKENEQNVTWKAADLFDLDEITKVMEGVDTAIYLVHSMMPNAKLTQANFEDMDALLADNFARAAKKQGVKHIVFMSGLIPNEDKLSAHLRSRLECEKILGSYGIPVSTLRAGLIIGAKGSSYPILKRLVERLPGMVLPSWAYHMIAPVSINDVIDKLALLVKRTPQHNEAFDITGPEIMNYKELIQRTAVVLNKRLPIVDLPIIPIWVSRYWVQLISQVPKEMVYPLMNSLVHDMIPQPERTHPDISIGKMSYEESVEQALNEENKMNQKQNKNKKSSSESKKESIKDVRAISRFSIPANYSMEDVAKTYATFINNITLHLINGTINENKFDITLPFTNQFILKMERDMEDSSEDMIVYKIVGGNLALSNNGGNARFEFRRILDTNEAIVALQEYEPTLPWVVYKYTQANIHKTVMELFVNHMNKRAEEDKQASSYNNQLFSTVAMTTGAIVGAYLGSKIYHLIKA
ncbi:NAD(P)H-binding protein [Staphylococcus sp. GDY8P57P]|uniref:NmrA family NAD(P)-binding protein n=1 Tax=Staphylococcus sp. GDY8P57P TaxID=2804128 RepID=UPI00187F2C49|nr:NAD(P)H-binding protein [Staphylococcus sp. GDY8P57P]MBF2756774.1 NAD(P)H-binding protein [Staphylococcus haemolyticus]MBF2772829.1 NAD(P)H-binding protein [Staphylococcus haemolyticus]MBF2775555.1 NAD(P)H-binding protein [Staphylococcus haemolyticus]MBF2814856.1 NAD(P)H-binding protein [Staphylococcus haemolyticus]MBF9720117.1 NAD(P)H-binding protein [Staphylococcus haemolyticus]